MYDYYVLLQEQRQEGRVPPSAKDYQIHMKVVSHVEQ